VSLPRLVLVTRRFWPLVGGAEVVMARLAAALKQRGAAVTLLTARWRPDWPETIEHHGVRVVRLAQPATRIWGTLRYMQAVARWVRRHAQTLDLAYVSMLKHDAYAVLGAAGRRLPVVLRAEGAGVTGDCFWQVEARCGRRIRRRCQQAAALVAPSRAIEDELIAAGYPRDRIHFIPNGVPLFASVTPTARHAARAALGQVQRALELPRGAPLAVYTGRLHEGKGLAHLVAAWPLVLQRHPQARLWLVGEGPSATALAEQIRALGVEGRVVLAGSFDDVEEVLQAADLFVLPSLEEGMSLALLEAMSLGLPLVATDIAANRALVADGVHGRLVPAGQPAKLAEAVIEAFCDASRAARWGEQARQRVAAEFALDHMVDRHLELFERLLGSAGSQR
jgi:glycosyltransferase involved in cell wall biosynthesis